MSQQGPHELGREKCSMPMVPVSISVWYRTILWGYPLARDSFVMAELIAVGGSDLCGVAVDGTGATFVASRGSGAILAREGVQT